MQSIAGKRVAVLATDGFEQSELLQPRRAIEDAGGIAVIVSPKEGRIRGWDHDHWGQEITVDLNIEDARAADFDALMLPGGVMNPDHLRMDPRCVHFVREFFEQDKPVGAICHAPWMLVEADVVRGRRVTSWPSVHTDLRNAGAEWVDQEVVVDGGLLVTSRKPADLPAFCRTFIGAIANAPVPEPA